MTKDEFKTLEVMSDVIQLERIEDKKNTVGKIIIPDSHAANNRLGRGIIRGIGPNVEETDLKIGDTVLFDTLSVFGGKDYFGVNSKMSILRVENVVAFIDDDNVITPIGARVLCQEKENEELHKQGSLFIPVNLSDVDKFVKVIAVGSKVDKDFELKPGDEIIAITENDIFISIDTQKYVLIEDKNIIAKKTMGD